MIGLRQAAARAVERVARARSQAMPASELARPALIVAPHQDDETLGCGGLIALKRRLRVAVDVVFLTDGRTSHARFMAQDELAARRRDEALAACAELGVPAAAVSFLDFADGELGEHREAAAVALGETLQAYPDRQIFVPYAGDTTPDHVHSRQVTLDALARMNAVSAHTVCEYPVWFWHHWPWVAPPLSRRRQLPRVVLRGWAAAWRRLADLTEHVDIEAVLATKESALGHYRTQMVRPAEHTDWPVLSDVASGEWLAQFFTGREYFLRYESTGDSLPRS